VTLLLALHYPAQTTGKDNTSNDSRQFTTSAGTCWLVVDGWTSNTSTDNINWINFLAFWYSHGLSDLKINLQGISRLPLGKSEEYFHSPVTTELSNPPLLMNKEQIVDNILCTWCTIQWLPLSFSVQPQHMDHGCYLVHADTSKFFSNYWVIPYHLVFMVSPYLGFNTKYEWYVSMDSPPLQDTSCALKFTECLNALDFDSLFDASVNWSTSVLHKFLVEVLFANTIFGKFYTTNILCYTVWIKWLIPHPILYITSFNCFSRWQHA